MFAEELEVCKVYSIRNREELYTHSKMWAICTSVYSDEYEDIFSPEVKQKLQEVLMFEFHDVDKIIPKSLTKYVEICYKDNEIKQSSVTTEIPFVFMADGVEWHKLTSELQFDDNLRERIDHIFSLNSPTDIFCDKVIIDNNGNTIGVSISPTMLKPNSFIDTDLRRIYETASNLKQFVDFDLMHNDDDIVIHTKQPFNLIVYGVPRDESDSSLLGYKKFKPTKQTYEKSLEVQFHIEDQENLFIACTGDDVEYLKSLITHPSQEIDFSYIFYKDGNLKDVLAYKREVKNFEVWRS
ncbi:hypothetical protein S-PM2d230 [Synechococcus phage S-PM2]|uniref:Hypothetical-Protein / belonging to T4-LIKE GC: 743 n=1 Tax=Synechococcus phage S-PM2 TaxID=238854 RepID=Q5GQA7_BPSYP|nr:Hypothetical-Protein / belonging to T4-LIKE GC: 743 [Synechococcus phage S-PM2]CAF34295.1 Hypothetical-Protein / belonging to T4-LIKE GC: 743 [Synechococcus phage S-PM2]CFW42472.1 hypothetical protein S-PM2d230 [Synechococcus phage S-PM2]